MKNDNYDISSDVERLIERSGINPGIFRGKTVLVTGGTGFFGVWLLSALCAIRNELDGDLRLFALSRSPDRFLKAYSSYDFATNVEFLRGDIRSFTLNGERVSHLVHMAAPSAHETYAGEDQLNKLDMLYAGTRNVLDQCVPTLENVLFTSSGVAYGMNNNALISESDHSGPDTTQTGSALCIGKIAAEYLIAYYAEKFNYRYAIARCFAFAGQHLPLDLHYAFGNFIRNALNAEDIVIRSDGQDMRSYLYIGDAIAWMLRLLSAPDNQMYNVGSQQSISIESLARKIAAQAPLHVEVIMQNGHNEVGNFSRKSYVPNVGKIISAYPGLAEWTTLQEIISKMLSTRQPGELECI